MPVTEQEKKILDMTGEVWNAFLTLPVEHPSDRDEFMRNIHALQNIILSRSAYRVLKQSLNEQLEKDIYLSAL